MLPFETFNDLNLPLPLADALRRMKFETPTPVQSATIPIALTGRDILATAQTGTGKTGAFAIPLISGAANDRARQALILAPTRELAAQIFTVITQMSGSLRLKGALVVGGESFSRQASDLRQGCHFIVATPGRLNDHLQERTVKLGGIELLVLDEVDRMLDMGFLPQIKQIMRHVPVERQTMLFSATMPKEILGLASSFLKNPERVSIGAVSQKASDVKEEIIRTTNQGKNGVILKEIDARQGRILVFARTKSRTERLARMLYQEGHDIVCLHGGRSQAQRKQALARFRDGSHRIMVATDLAGRGIDVNDIEHVINYDLPGSREDYIHRIGRTGRCGKTGNALNLLTAEDSGDEHVVSGVKAPSRVVFRSRRGPVRRMR